MAAVHGVCVLEAVEALGRGIVARVNDPAVRLHEHRGAEVLVPVPPVGGAAGGAAGAEHALVEPVQLLAVLHVLQQLHLLALGRLLVALQPRLDGLVLAVEVGEVRHQVLDHVHVRQRVDLGGLVDVRVDVADAGQRVDAVDVHGAGAAHALAARAPERQRGVHLVLDLQQRVEHHGRALVQVHLVVLHGGLLVGLVGVPAVHGEGLHALGERGGRGQRAQLPEGARRQPQQRHYVMFFRIGPVDNTSSLYSKRPRVRSAGHVSYSLNLCLRNITQYCVRNRTKYFWAIFFRLEMTVTVCQLCQGRLLRVA